MNKQIGIITGIVVITGIALVALSGNTAKDSPVTNLSNEAEMARGEESEIEMTNEAEMEMTNEVEVAKEAVPLSEAVMPAAPVEAQMANGSFETYSAEKVTVAEGDIIIFFHATWCPSCRALINDIESNLGSIPAGTTILKADYDTETELKKKYGVTTQHTLVQVDTNGTLIKKWSGGSKLESLLSQIQ